MTYHIYEIMKEYDSAYKNVVINDQNDTLVCYQEASEIFNNLKWVFDNKVMFKNKFNSKDQYSCVGSFESYSLTYKELYARMIETNVELFI